MSISLEAIKFNHDPNSATVDALNIRKNATQFVNVPEWRRGISVVPEDAPAAYALKETQGKTITIQAKFKRADPSITTCYVRAIDPVAYPKAPAGCLGTIYSLLVALLGGLFRAILRALFGNVLGEVKEKQVTFTASGETNFETFQLQYVKLWSAGVGVHTTTWRWQYRIQAADPWTDFTTSTHRIYTILGLPTAPWQQTPYNSGNTQLPWAEVLDYACTWAAATKNPDAAAGGVTRAVFGLGPAVVEYDCPGGGSTHYAWGSFNCTAFLDRLHGGVGNGVYVNCTDCGTFVSSFANILGCDLWQSRMGWGFDLNEILGIGSNVWQTACGWGGFSYHEVAWKDACLADDEVFDGCLEVDGDADPTAAPHTPLLPVNMRFGNPGDGDYRDRLCTPAGSPNCAPQPATRQRRAVV
ncbi:MAG: hypothetical protein ABW250_06895 [Pyrinomonadaceae bacterium]